MISSFTYCINNHIMDHESSINYRAFCLLFPKFDWNIIMYILCCLIVIANPSNLYNEQSAPFLIHDLYLGLYQIRVITKLPNSEQSYKGKVKTHNYINRQNQSTTENCENRNDPYLVQAFLKKWWVESDFKAPNLPLSLRLKGIITILKQNR